MEARVRHIFGIQLDKKDIEGLQQRKIRQLSIYYMVSHLSKAGGALVVYDITKERTFESVKYWMELLKKECNPEVVIFLIGNKVDLVEKDP
jgi:GTPase SAR1 family protein